MGKLRFVTFVSAAALVAGLSGCATVQGPATSNQLQQELRDKEAKQAKLEAEVARLKQDLAVRGETVTEPTVVATGPSTADLPPAAKAGECYARVFTPPTYTTKTETVLASQADEKVEIIPAEYTLVEERVLVKEASERLEVVPAKYDWVEERVLVTEESEKLVEIPAQYETVTETILVRPASTIWKKGKGPIQRVDHATGEIMCLVEVPAEYKTVTKRVVKTPATTKKVVIPAEYNTVKRQVQVEPPTTITVEIPAEYKTMRVKKLARAAEERRYEIPAEYTTVAKREMVSEGRLVWQPILCETNASPTLITDLQRALIDAGYEPGPVDGKMGRGTLRAVEKYQKDEGLASGQLTLETLKKLDVPI